MESMQQFVDAIPRNHAIDTSQLQGLAQDLAEARTRVALLEAEYTSELLRLCCDMLPIRAGNSDSDQAEEDSSISSPTRMEPELVAYIDHYYAEKNRWAPWDSLTEYNIERFREKMNDGSEAQSEEELWINSDQENEGQRSENALE
ncbi:hypothetical protein BV22DRAFT_1134040 [Leucogyrophana mollusca]|uniref:Uncharacterized protein n=1 Tax=Leucogyrophana mollusca TaxID=85980 RepID=A0ACB8B356_9AGAM|nr:hypothetical protein BV22DRAFT_1134040 [Leucogyrophana mollusca]